ncbi:MAG: ribose 5-phosphate isomerase B [Clostridia bacterium]
MIALASDHVGLALKQALLEYLEQEGVPCRDYGTFDTQRCHYPEYALAAAKAVSGGECRAGILCCGTGVGMAIAANKVRSIRCVVCSDCYSAVLSRQHNDTNMLALGSQVVGPGLAKRIVESWLSAEFEGGRHQIRLDQIRAIEVGGEIPPIEGR